jgi:putative ABC transport system substrate-binding protein
MDYGAAQRIPVMYEFSSFVQDGGLMSYGPNAEDNFRRVAYYVDRILKGAKPGDLPMEQPTKFELVINVKTAKALGIKIPDSIMLRADKLIE